VVSTLNEGLASKGTRFSAGEGQLECKLVEKDLNIPSCHYVRVRRVSSDVQVPGMRKGLTASPLRDRSPLAGKTLVPEDAEPQAVRGDTGGLEVHDPERTRDQPS
jgi:hypothetical protein